MKTINEKNMEPGNDIKTHRYKKNEIAILIVYFTVLTISGLGWIFSELIEELIIGAGYHFVEDWIWGICFATFAGTMSIGLPKIIKILNGGKELSPETQKKFVTVLGVAVVVGFVFFVLGFVMNLS
jgi:hypothetical protein